MTANTRISFVNHWDELALSGGSIVSTLPRENTQKTSRGSKCRTSSTSDLPLLGSQATARAANVLIVAGHNLGGGSGTFRLQLYSDQAATTQVYDSTAQSVTQAASANAGANYGMADTTVQAADDFYGDTEPIVYYFPATKFKAAKITFHAGALATSYIEVGRIHLDFYTEMVANPAFGLQRGRGSNTAGARTLGGSLRTNLGETWRIIDATFDHVDPSQVAFIDDLMRKAELGTDIFFDGLPDDTTRLGRDLRMLGKMVALDPLVYSQFSFHTKRLVIEQL